MNVKFRAAIAGVFSAALLLTIYFVVTSLVSGINFALSQFVSFWYFIVALAAGFGIQVGLYLYLRSIVHRSNGAGKVLAVTGTNSTAVMISCCAHYLATILPVIGTTGIISLIGQYQIELFWASLVLNAAGIVYIVRKIISFHHS